MIFGLVFVSITLALDVWIFSSVYRILKRGELGPEWHKRALVLLIPGVVLGIYFAFLHKHEAPDALRFTGFPIPQQIFRYENKAWIDVSPPQIVQILALIVDFVTGFAAALFPVKIAAFFKEAKATLPQRPQ